MLCDMSITPSTPSVSSLAPSLAPSSSPMCKQAGKSRPECPSLKGAGRKDEGASPKSETAAPQKRSGSTDPLNVVLIGRFDSSKKGSISTMLPGANGSQDKDGEYHRNRGFLSKAKGQGQRIYNNANGMRDDVGTEQHENEGAGEAGGPERSQTSADTLPSSANDSLKLYLNGIVNGGWKNTNSFGKKEEM